MSVPKSVVKMKMKKGQCELTYTDSVDRVNYTMKELVRRANLDVGMYIAKLCNATAREELKFNRKSPRLGTRVSKAAFQFWARPKENDLQVGIKHDTWYGVNQEIGEKGMPKKGILRNTVYNNISNIRDIQGKYISAIEDEQKAIRLAQEAEEMKDIAED